MSLCFLRQDEHTEQNRGCFLWLLPRGLQHTLMYVCYFKVRRCSISLASVDMLQSTEKSEPKRDGDGSSSMSSVDLQPPASQSWSSSSTTGILSSPLVFHVCWLLPHTAITALQLKVFSVHTFVFLVFISFHCTTSLNRPSLQGIKYVFYCACWTFGRNVSRMMHKTFRSLMFDADVLFQSLMCHCSVTGLPTLYWSQSRRNMWVRKSNIHSECFTCRNQATENHWGFTNVQKKD